MKHGFILNPAAGKTDRTGEVADVIRDVFRYEDFEIEYSEGPGDCELIARQMAEAFGECRLYACGGDGTLNEVVNGAAGHPGCAVTHYPIGSGNDFIKASSDPGAFEDLSAFLDPEERTFDLIEANDRLGINICSVGIDARIGTQVDRYKRLPLVTGSGAYLLSTVVNVIKGVTAHYVVELAGERIDARQTMICVCNGRWYGGGFNPVPDALLDDGLLDVLLVRPVTRLQVAAVIGKYKAGRYREVPELIRHFRVPELRVRCDKPSAVNVDGELLTAEDVVFRVSPHKIHFFHPKGLVWEASPAAVKNL